MVEYLKRNDVLANSEILTFDTREYGRIDVVPVEYLANLPTVELKTVTDTMIDKEDVLRIIESFKVGGNQKLPKEEFERNFTLQLIQDEISGTICEQEE